MENSKACAKVSEGGCGKELPMSEFYSYPGKLNKTGERQKNTSSKRCRDCQRAINREYERNKPVRKANWERKVYKHVGPKRGSVEKLWFCHLRPTICI